MKPKQFKEIDSGLTSPTKNTLKSPKSYASPKFNSVSSPLKVPNQYLEEQASVLETESSFQMSPSKLRDLVHHSLSGLCSRIMQNAYAIEQNIKTESFVSSKIDLGIIENLKRRRLETQSGERQRGQELQVKRDEIIMMVQQKLEQEREL